MTIHFDRGSILRNLAIAGAAGIISACGGAPATKAVDSSPTPPAAAPARPTDSLPTSAPTSAPTERPTATATAQATRVVEATATPGPVEQKSLTGAQLKDTGQTMMIGGARYPVSEVLNPGVGGGMEPGSIEQKSASLAPFNTFMETSDGRMVSGVLDNTGKFVVMAEFKDGSWVMTNDGSVADLVKPVAGSGLVNLRGVNSDMTVGDITATVSEGQVLVSLPNVKPSQAVVGGKTYEFIEVVGRDGKLAWVAREVVVKVENRVAVATPSPTPAPTKAPEATATKEAATLPIPVGATYVGNLTCKGKVEGSMLLSNSGGRVVMLFAANDREKGKFFDGENRVTYASGSGGLDITEAVRGQSYKIGGLEMTGDKVGGSFTSDKIAGGPVCVFSLSRLTGEGEATFYGGVEKVYKTVRPEDGAFDPKKFVPKVIRGFTYQSVGN